MEYVKKINNNVALVTDDAGKEYIVIGNGIGFQKNPGDPVDETKIEKKFIAEESGSYQNILSAIQEIDPIIFEVSTKIINLAEKELAISFSNNNFFALADHINYAVQRTKDGNDYEDFTRIEIKKFYPKEYRMAQLTIELIKENTGVQLPASEEVYLTYHYLNANSKFDRADEAANMTHLIQRILDIIRYHFHAELKEDSISYSRFITHLRYFILRRIKKEDVDTEHSMGILEVVREKYEKSYQAAIKIGRFLLDERGWLLTDDEILYLTLHIERVVHDKQT